MTRARGEDGFLMVEVLMGAVVVILITLAILDGLDGAQDTTGKNKARSVAANLAQDDQERLRSMKITDLSNRRESRTVNVASVPYTVVSRADWVRDASGALSCSADATSAGDYLRITSTASSTTRRVAPVVEVGLVNPPPGSFGTNYGTTTIKVIDRAGDPVAGATVALDSSPALSDSTNALGCAVFGNLLAGAYTASVTNGSWVGIGGNTPVTVPATVTAEATTVAEVQLDNPAEVHAHADTKVGAADAQPARPVAVTVSNSRLPSGTLAFPNIDAHADFGIDARNLFPFEDGYGVYAGACDANDPTDYDAAYFDTNPGRVAADPGGLSAVTVRMPSINIRVRNTATPPQNLLNARVYVTPADAGCTQTFPMQRTNAAGVLPDPGYPFGTYRICADDNAGHSARTTTDVDNTRPAGTDRDLTTPAVERIRLNIDTADASGNCAP